MEPCFGILMWICLALGLFGLAIMSIGIIVQIIYSAGEGIVDVNFLSAPSMLIFAGIVIFVVAFLGCYGAAKKNYCLLMIFGTLMLLLFVLVFAGSIASYYNRGHLEAEMRNEFNATLMKYKDQEQVRKSWDLMQHDLKCCGIDNKYDWMHVYPNGSLPTSCCDGAAFNESSQSFHCPADKAYSSGCYSLLLDVIKSKITIIGSIAIIVAFVQLILVIFSCYLAGTVRSEYQTV